MAKNMKNAAELFTEDDGITVNPELYAENVEITGVDEIPENEEIVDEVVITDEQNDETIKDIEEDENFDIEEVEEITSDIFPTRGFKSLKDAKEWTKSPNFTNLGKADQAEFLDWLNNIK